MRTKTTKNYKSRDAPRRRAAEEGGVTLGILSDTFRKCSRRTRGPVSPSCVRSDAETASGRRLRPLSHSSIQQTHRKREQKVRRRKSLQRSMTEFWVCFSCCVAEQPQPKRRRRIDRSMIGEPTNFVHMTHVGSGEMGTGLGAVDSVQSQMKSKGGYGNGTVESVQA